MSAVPPWPALIFRQRKGQFMDSSVLQKQFARMGARLKVREGPMPWRVRDSGFSVDVGHDQHGTFFDIIAAPALQEA